MGLDVWFPLAIYSEDLAESASHNPDLLAKIRARFAAVGTIRTSDTSSWTGDVHDVDRLHLDPDFDWLTGEVERHALIYLKLLGHDLAKMDVHIQRSWPVIARRGQRVARHAHHTAHLSVVYYVAAAPDTTDAGQIRFINDARMNELAPGIGSDMTRGYSEMNALNFGSALYQPVPGRILVFPAKQTHAVEPNLTDVERVSVSYDLVLTARDAPGEGHHEFLMPSPSIWRRIGHGTAQARERRTTSGCDDPAVTVERGVPPSKVALPARTALARFGAPADALTLASQDGHILWTSSVLADCTSAAQWRDIAALIPPSLAPAGETHENGDAVGITNPAVDLLRAGPLAQIAEDAIGRVYRVLRDRDIALDQASVSAPLLRHSADAVSPMQRGHAHLCLYLRLDFDMADCRIEFDEDLPLDLPPGGLALVSGLRCHRVVGRAVLLQFDIDLPAVARTQALSVEALWSRDVSDRVVFAAATALPLAMPLPPPGLLAAKFDWLERRDRRRYRQASCPAVQRYLFDHADPADASSEDLARIKAHGSGEAEAGRLEIVPAMLDERACAQLRAYAEAHMTSIVPDTVDDLPEYQVNLTIAGLRELIGAEAAEALLRMPHSFGAGDGDGLERLDIFLRKYSPETRSSIAFHADNCTYTLNVPLTAPDRYEGGRLLALHGGCLVDLTRPAGTAILHAGNLVHGVTRLVAGTRHALILFFSYRAATLKAESAAA